MSAHRLRLSATRVAWWAEIPVGWRLVWTISLLVPLPCWILHRAIRASVDACHRWIDRRDRRYPARYPPDPMDGVQGPDLLHDVELPR